MTLHTQIFETEGREFIMLPADEFAIPKDTLEDYEDLKALREEKASADSEPTRSLDTIIKEVEREH